MNIKEAYQKLSEALPEQFMIGLELWGPEWSLPTPEWSVWSTSRQEDYKAQTLSAAVALAIEAHTPRAERFDPLHDKLGQAESELAGVESVGKEEV
jgi:hypothetical protein